MNNRVEQTYDVFFWLKKHQTLSNIFLFEDKKQIPIRKQQYNTKLMGFLFYENNKKFSYTILFKYLYL